MFSQGTFVGDSTSHLSLYSEIASMLTSHPAWEFVHQRSDTEEEWRIWKNLGSANGEGRDFHIGIAVASPASGQTFLRFRAFEEYDAANLLTRKPCIRGTVNHLVAADGSIGNDWHARTHLYGLNGSQTPNGLVWTATTTQWKILLTNRFLWVVTDNQWPTGNGCFVGLFDSLIPDHPNEFPLLSHETHTGTTGQPGSAPGGWSRHPRREGLASSFHFATWPVAQVSARVGQQFGNVGDSPDGFTQTYIGTPIYSTSVNFNMMGMARGIMPAMLGFATSPGVVFGDRVTADGLTYHLVHNSSNGPIWMAQIS